MVAALILARILTVLPRAMGALLPGLERAGQGVAAFVSNGRSLDPL